MTIRDRVRALPRWAHLLAAFALGALSALAQAPYGLLPVLFVSFGGLFLLLDAAATCRRPLFVGFATGFAFGFGAMALGIYWVAFAFLVQAEQFAWLIPVLVPGLMAYLALYAGLAGWLTVLVWRAGWSGDVTRVAVMAGAWSLGEVLRGEVFDGFPWNLVSQSATAFLPLAQAASWAGPYGLSLLMVALATMPVLFLYGRRRRPVLGLGALAALILVGALGMAPTMMRDDAALVVVQPSVPQRDKLDPAKQEAALARMAAMTAEAARGTTPTTYAVWPENAYRYLDEVPGIEAGLAAAMPDGVVLITGAVRAEPAGGTDYAFYNAIQVFGATRDGLKPLTATYDKHHLVPFGEFLPLGGFFRTLGLDSLAPGGFTPGPGPRTLPIGPAPFAPLVCYEGVFPGELYPASDRPDWIAISTNDAWFGDRAGPRQHLAIGQMRAIESGLPVARSANTGISAVIGPRGRILNQLPLYQPGVLTQPLPAPLRPTPYDVWSDLIWALMLLLVVFAPNLSGLASRG